MILAVLSFLNKYKGGGMYIIFASDLFGKYCFCGDQPHLVLQFAYFFNNVD